MSAFDGDLNAARKISSVGGSIKDVQMLARHSSLSMTQRYIEADVEAMKKVVELVYGDALDKVKPFFKLNGEKKCRNKVRAESERSRIF